MCVWGRYIGFVSSLEKVDSKKFKINEINVESEFYNYSYTGNAKTTVCVYGYLQEISFLYLYTIMSCDFIYLFVCFCARDQTECSAY